MERNNAPRENSGCRQHVGARRIDKPESRELVRKSRTRRRCGRRGLRETDGGNVPARSRELHRDRFRRATKSASAGGAETFRKVASGDDQRWGRRWSSRGGRDSHQQRRRRSIYESARARTRRGAAHGVGWTVVIISGIDWVEISPRLVVSAGLFSGMDFACTGLQRREVVERRSS